MVHKANICISVYRKVYGQFEGTFSLPVCCRCGLKSVIYGTYFECNNTNLSPKLFSSRSFWDLLLMHWRVNCPLKAIF